MAGASIAWYKELEFNYWNINVTSMSGKELKIVQEEEQYHQEIVGVMGSYHHEQFEL